MIYKGTMKKFYNQDSKLYDAASNAFKWVDFCWTFVRSKKVNKIWNHHSIELHGVVLIVEQELVEKVKWKNSWINRKWMWTVLTFRLEIQHFMLLLISCWKVMMWWWNFGLTFVEQISASFWLTKELIVISRTEEDRWFYRWLLLTESIVDSTSHFHWEAD